MGRLNRMRSLTLGHMARWQWCVSVFPVKIRFPALVFFSFKFFICSSQVKISLKLGRVQCILMYWNEGTKSHGKWFSVINRVAKSSRDCNATAFCIKILSRFFQQWTRMREESKESLSILCLARHPSNRAQIRTEPKLERNWATRANSGRLRFGSGWVG